MQLQHRVVMRCIGEREAAAQAAFGENVDVLPCKKLQSFAGRQPQVNPRHVGCKTFEFLHAARQRAYLNIFDRADFAALNHHIGHGFGLTEQRVTPFLVGVGEGRFLKHAVIDYALQYFAFATAAGAVAAAVGDIKTFAQRGIQNGFVAGNGKNMVAGLNRDLAGHGVKWFVI